MLRVSLQTRVAASQTRQERELRVRGPIEEDGLHRTVRASASGRTGGRVLSDEGPHLPLEVVLNRSPARMVAQEVFRLWVAESHTANTEQRVRQLRKMPAQHSEEGEKGTRVLEVAAIIAKHGEHPRSPAKT
eukprot:5418467-Pleurochrysis_carterae.AAC.1